MKLIFWWHHKTKRSSELLFVLFLSPSHSSCAHPIACPKQFASDCNKEIRVILFIHLQDDNFIILSIRSSRVKMVAQW